MPGQAKPPRYERPTSVPLEVRLSTPTQREQASGVPGVAAGPGGSEDTFPLAPYLAGSGA
jgi:hypothetical protein